MPVIIEFKRGVPATPPPLRTSTLIFTIRDARDMLYVTTTASSTHTAIPCVPEQRPWMWAGAPAHPWPGAAPGPS